MTLATANVLDLIQRHRAGDKVALDRLIRTITPTLWRMCESLARRTGDEADDLFQDTLLHVVRYLDGYRGDAAFTTWVYAVARSRSIRRRRRASTGTDVLGDTSDLREDDPCPGPWLDEQLASRELGERLEQTLAHLAEVDREILVCRDALGMTANEVAARVGLSVPAVKTRLHRARTHVRASMVGEAPQH